MKRCMCEVPVLGIVDGDRQTITCNNCGAVVSDFERVKLNRLVHANAHATNPPSGSTMDLIKTMDGWLFNQTRKSYEN